MSKNMKNRIKEVIQKNKDIIENSSDIKEIEEAKQYIYHLEKRFYNLIN